MCGGADQLQRWEILGNIWHVPTKTLLEKSFQTISDTKFISIMAKIRRLQNRRRASSWRGWLSLVVELRDG